MFKAKIPSKNSIEFHENLGYTFSVCIYMNQPNFYSQLSMYLSAFITSVVYKYTEVHLHIAQISSKHFCPFCQTVTFVI